MVNFLLIFGAVVIVGKIKSALHWKYLRLTDHELSKYPSFEEYKKRSKMESDSEITRYSSLAVILLIPYFELEKINNAEKKVNDLKAAEMARWYVNIASTVYLGGMICLFFGNSIITWFSGVFK